MLKKDASWATITSKTLLSFLMKFVAGMQQDRQRLSLIQCQSYDAMTSSFKTGLIDFTTSVLGQPIDRNFQPSANYIGELLGVEYLYNKTGAIVEVIDIDK
ncbi:hypothetical protein DAPPUDRAFT_325627 [Daphnia pulex]|uniref:Uncharacterized protein n=1 Tax=Daphnia pulex TaxID=6669 RepID=E9H5B1_DAPPU|nr:hypothetical protein DAPPUDRAFT_325627 [Daphnia pulex]|eukprot:EFX73109.1 hypothetical protein DAPPUDRAFT_325627 [Daphnia pulex]